LSLVDSVYQGADGYRFDVGQGEEVLSPSACQDVLDMMAIGAEEGTGRNVASSKQCPEFAYIGTKTGTTEKSETEICIHVELQHALEHKRTNTSCSKECYRSLRGKRDHKGLRNTCYTSSMCAVGRLTDDGPTLMTLVVVEDARSKKKFGGDVAGPSAILLLRRALGLTAETGRDLTLSVPRLPEDAFGQYDLPWLEEGDSVWATMEKGTTEDE
ncbi:MAG: hypothetical protein KDB61_15885, partial [Planctomycetes bacterium]|nr:hypothetical protein [Planctomycetota bacterium]